MDKSVIYGRSLRLNLNDEILKTYEEIRKLQADLANLAKEFYEQSVVSYDEISGAPTALSFFDNDTNFVSEEEVDLKILSIPPIDDSNYLKKDGEDSLQCSITTTFEALKTTTQEAEDRSENVATTEFVHQLVETSSEDTIEYISGIYQKDAVTESQMQTAILQAIASYDAMENVELQIANAIASIVIPSKVSDLLNDSGFITIGDVPGDLVTSVNGQTGDVSIQIPVVPTNISVFNNDAGYITDPGVTAVNNQTGAVFVQENVQANWNSTSGLSAILNKPALKRVATSGSYTDLDDKPTIPTSTSELTNDSGFLTEHQDISGKANTADLAAVALSGSYEDLENKPEIPVDDDLVHKSGDEVITGEKTFVGLKRLKFKQSSNSDKLGFTCYNKSDIEFGNFEVLPQDRAVNLGIYNVNSTPARDYVVGFKIQAKDSTGVMHKFGLRAPSRLGNDTFTEYYIPACVNGVYADIAGNITLTAAGIGAATIADVQTEIASLVDQAPTTLDTLNELATALGNDPNFATTIAGQIGAKYTKPDGGIPKTDLTSDVQASLDKADTALQSFTETDPTVPAWAKAANKPTYTAVEVGALPDTTVIPLVLDYPQGTETDAAPSVSAVQRWISEVDFRYHIDDNTIGINSDEEMYVKSISADKLANGTNNKVFTASEQTKLSGIATGAEVNVQANWNETDTTSDAYIQNKPNITLSSNGNWDYLNITGEIINLNTSYKAFYDGKEIATKDDIPTVPATYAASTTAGGAALKTGSIPFGVVDSTSTATAFTATVDGITELTDGTCVLLKNSVVTSAAGFTININNLGAYPAFNNMSAATAETTIFNINYTMLFVFDSTRVVGESTGAWCCYRGYDANTNTIGYQLRTNSSTMPASDKGYRYRLWFTSADGTKYVPANKSTSTNATTARTMNTTPIDPFGRIFYYSSNATTSAGANLTATTCWELYTVTIGYSYVLSMTSYKPVYVQCTPQADGSAVMNTLTLMLPSTEDGKIYIFLGIAYSATNMELMTEHPVYYYKNGAIRLWTNAEEVTLPSLSGYETTSNKVTSISSSSTDNEYPTAKCVYDIIGNIQTLLLNI